jgi:formate-dependent nitrite reductase membrane component NrfD
MIELDSSRHSNLVDPQLHVWGWEVPVYLFLGGLAAGVMILSALLLARPGERSRAARWLPFAAPLLVSVGMGALFLDLAHKLYVWRFYLAFRWTSPMSWGAWILLLVYPVSLLVALASLSAADAEGLAARLGRAGPWVGRARAFALARLAPLRQASLATGVALGIYTGILLSTLGARALWSSALLGPLFLVSGVSAGAAFLMLFPLSEDERRFLARWDVYAMGLEVLVILLLLAGLATGGAASREAAGLLLGGRYTAEFWTLVVGVGLAVPAVLSALEHRLHLRWTLVAPALVLLGGLSLRFILVAAGQA